MMTAKATTDDNDGDGIVLYFHLLMLLLFVSCYLTMLIFNLIDY